MKRTPLIRKTPMRRRARMAAGAKSAYRLRPRDFAYMAWVRRQPCCARDLGGCSGRVEADHAGSRGLGRKADDDTCIPLCHAHHVQRGSFSGPFRTWDQVQMRGWLTSMVDVHQTRFRTTTRHDTKEIRDVEERRDR